MAEVKLTQAQQAVVDNRGGPLLVAAAAGSGKTKVLVDRLMGYIMDKDDPADIDQFLIITYTKAAASELRTKIAARLTELLAVHTEDRHLRRQLQRLYLAKISTVHSFCAEVLRDYAFALDLPGDMRTAEENECAEMKEQAMETVLEEAYSAMGSDPDFCIFADSQGAGRDDRDLPVVIEAVYSKSRCNPDPRGWLRRCVSNCEADGITDASQTIWGDHLIGRLKSFVDDQLQVLERLREEHARTEYDNNRSLPTIESIITLLQSLRACKTWDEFGDYCQVKLPSLAKKTKRSDPELIERAKAIRTNLSEQLAARLLPFAKKSDDLLEEMNQSAASVRALEKLVLRFGDLYDREKLRRRCLDFGDLEHRTLDLLQGKNRTGPTRAAADIGARFREVMVDEYQDSNQVQEEIFGAITQEKGNIFMVGDVKQSIYGFRLADPSIFLDKYEAFPPAKEAQPGEGRKILLSQNFRSGADVLEAANQVFSLCMSHSLGGLHYGEEEELKPGPNQTPIPGPAVELHCIEGALGGKDARESAFVAERICRMLEEGTLIRTKTGTRPVTPGDITILLRSPGTNAVQFIEALEARGIPVTTESTSDILTSDEITILRALLQVLDNPLQDIPLETVLASPVFGFTADHLAKIRAADHKSPLYHSLMLAAENGDSEAEQFLTRFTAFRETARLETLARLVEEIYRLTHMESIFAAMTDGEKRRSNLSVFYEQAVAFEQGGRRDLPQFLTYLERLEQRKGLQVDAAPAGGAVSIVSIHKSKGLEYPVVFLCDLAASFNDQDTRKNVLVDAKLGIGCSVLDRGRRLRYPDLAKQAIMDRMRAETASEELRVLYVAMTRAKDRLIMTYAYGSNLVNKLASYTNRMELETAGVLAKEARNLGHWVLETALFKTEAGELFAQAGRPPRTFSGNAPWLIQYHAETEPEENAETEAPAAPPAPVTLPQAEKLTELLTARYAHPAAVQAPSKVTATQLKGRNLDQEAADGAFTPLAAPNRHWRKPEFLTERPLQGKEIGTATHLAMQFIRYEACACAQGIDEELTRLTESEFITRRQAEAVNRAWIARFFETDLGRRLMTGRNVLREFKFSLLEDGGTLDPDLQGEELLLQGVVDCCLMEDDGITVLDFKTDRVKPGSEQTAADRYAPQVRAYGSALTRIFGKPVKQLLLYFFQTGCLMEVPEA